MGLKMSFDFNKENQESEVKTNTTSSNGGLKMNGFSDSAPLGAYDNSSMKASKLKMNNFSDTSSANPPEENSYSNSEPKENSYSTPFESTKFNNPKSYDYKSDDNILSKGLRILKSKKFIIPVSICAVLIIALCIGMSVRRNSDSYLYGLLDDGNVSKISELYVSNYSKNANKQSDFIDKIDTYAESNFNEYVNDSISYDELMRKYSTIQSVYDRFSINDSEFESNMKSADSIKELKTMYQKGIAYMEEKNYPDAIEVFEEILKKSKNYPNVADKMSEAKSAYKQQLMSQADEKINSKDYSGALEILEKGENYFTDDSTFSSKITEVKNNVKNTALSEAESAFSTEGYQKSITIIETAISFCGENEELTNALNKYKAYVPVNIVDIDPSETSRNNKVEKGETGVDNTNQTHKKNLYAFHRLYSQDDAYAVYPLMGKYDTLTFEAYRSNYDTSTDESITIKIFGDNTELQSIVIDKGFNPNQYSIDISGVQKLKIVFESYDTNVFKQFDKLPGELANVIVSKTK